jgi:hypothetical protein
MFWAIVGAVIFLVLLGNFPRATLGVLGVAVLGVILFVWRIDVVDSRKMAERNAVTAYAFPILPAPGCPENLPILVTFTNGAKRTVQAIHWELKVRRRGHSTNLASLYLTPVMDKILAPGQKTALCYRLPSLSETHPIGELQPVAEVSWLDF